MSEGYDPIREAVAAHRPSGCTVKPWSIRDPLWLIDSESLTDGDLMVLVMCPGLMGSPRRLQRAAAMAKDPATVSELREAARPRAHRGRHPALARLEGDGLVVSQICRTWTR